MSRFTVTVFCGSSPGFDPVYLDAARAVGAAIGAAGMSLAYGGGHVGLMGAVADAAVAAGAEVTGVIPRALQAREEVNDNLTELILVDTMHERKMIMADRADAFLALPGGPGTLEELTEQWTWAQLGIHDKPVGILNVDGYFDPLLAFVANMRDRGFTHPRYTDMLVVATEPGEALARLRDYVPPVRAEASPGAEMTGAIAVPVRP
ncbi:TIGR00730 family Rossman fold protein [Microbacterium flavum]|uniref:Cytokinin riboside 5'-monophosphate phosphoribohydrolase n=1 Tax=Microbacterium flavum TaxID=415216 RepID=A0ABS5XXW9_9MICO|nr:TIGR00730 family Rossman fold protein [Microbacterium flavum]MBT8799385.1 TIGR00730 family Rossman fold protein [Microbacterium flavum]